MIGEQAVDGDVQYRLTGESDNNNDQVNSRCVLCIWLTINVPNVTAVQKLGLFFRSLCTHCMIPYLYTMTAVISNSGAGSGMAGMAAAISICNLVWRRHTNLMTFGQLILRKIIKTVAIKCQNLRLKYLGLQRSPRPSSWKKGDLLLREGEGCVEGRGGKERKKRKGSGWTDRNGNGK